MNLAKSRVRWKEILVWWYGVAQGIEALALPACPNPVTKSFLRLGHT